MRRSGSLREMSPAAAPLLMQVYRPLGFGAQSITGAIRLRKVRRPGASLAPVPRAHELHEPEPRFVIEWSKR